jgi:hypothetical protein
MAFHRALGMDVLEVADYARIGRARVVFTARVEDDGKHTSR